MDARQQEYPQSGLSSPYPTFPEPASEGVSVDQASAAQYPSQGQDPRASNLTPTSDYSLNPSSARSGSFPDYIQRSYQPGAQGQAPGGMAQQQNPSIAAATSPTYSHQQQYSPYTPHHDMQHYPGHPQTPIYPSRPEWAGQYPQPGMHYGHPASSGPPAPAMVSPVQRPPTGGHPLSTVYSFVPIPGAQQHKRPRRRYEEIERMYKCGWNGCEKAYGTLNHLNAHVTMQSHGQKRTPEEFKEIRKEWKAKKKEEEAQRKADDERHRADAQQRHEGPPGEAPVYGQMRQAVGVPGQGPQHAQLPPIGYQPAASGNNAPPQYGTQSPGLPEGMAHYPQSPYGQNPQMYQQGH
ncbi:C2H2 zinc finger transcription factor PnCon7 isoform C [Parastagonospora nodorum SN15]|uniref:C2H2 zinc finger transcription factor PnCon7 isoform C n=1 Tax=Phaeosphaeria nodorum (strain SN15 / ATCC MYA-4574 / FGSC 10173) TaxID=321614 RepID=A0A7U2EVC2_PHANO|nr:C2H2 zinc finger transcription factor PnCon7 isoform C [Parastagonospora nodorum SN15]